MRSGIAGAVLGVAAAGCAGGPAPPVPPPRVSEPPPAADALLPAFPDLRGAALRAREAVAAVLGAPVPEEAAVPVVATREELEEALVEELRPQVAMLHPDAPESSRELLLRATARSSARSLVARYSPALRRVLVARENLFPQMASVDLPRDRTTAEAFLTLVLAHEQVHAVDDAAHDLAGLFRSVPDAEALRALGMVVEGRAVHFARQAAERLGLPPEVAAILPGGTGPLDERRARFFLTYREGAAFAADLAARGGTELAARPLRDPPRRTSTVFHPRRYGPGGEDTAPDPAAAMRSAGFEGAAAASELDLRARWIPRLGEEAVSRAFAGFLAGAGVHRDGGGASLSIHESEEAARAYAGGLRGIYGMDAGDEEGTVEGMTAVVLQRGRAVGSALAAGPARARADALRALEAATAR